MSSILFSLMELFPFLDLHLYWIAKLSCVSGSLWIYCFDHQELSLMAATGFLRYLYKLNAYKSWESLSYLNSTCAQAFRHSRWNLDQWLFNNLSTSWHDQIKLLLEPSFKIDCTNDFSLNIHLIHSIFWCTYSLVLLRWDGTHKK